MLVCLSSISGAPGVSSWGLLLATAMRRGPRRILFEADVSGGVLGSRYGLAVEPGVRALVSECCRGPNGALDPASYCHFLTEDAWCLAGPIGPGPAEAVWSAGAAAVGSRLVDDDNLWLADCGRLPAGDHPSRPLVERADAHLVFTSGRAEAVLAIGGTVTGLSAAAPVGVIVVDSDGRRRPGPDCVGGPDRVWTVDRVERLAELAWAASSSRRARHSMGWRIGLELAAAIDDWLPAPRPVPPLPPPWAYHDRGPDRSGVADG